VLTRHPRTVGAVALTKTKIQRRHAAVIMLLMGLITSPPPPGPKTTERPRAAPGIRTPLPSHPRQVPRGWCLKPAGVSGQLVWGQCGVGVM